MQGFLSFLFATAFLLCAAYGVYAYVSGTAIGSVEDWIVGICSFIWLLIIVTIPWNAHFKAREVLDEAAISKRKNILVIDETLAYAQKIAKRSFIVAIALHVVSALVLFVIAASGYSVVAYYAAALMILFALVRPAIRFYDYLDKRLNAIKVEFIYPRDDVYELVARMEETRSKTIQIEELLSNDPEKDSWRNDTDKKIADAQQRDKELYNEIVMLREELNRRFATIEGDSKLIESVRELISFIKKA